MSELGRWNSLHTEDAVSEILPCCGSKNWARQMAARRPIADEIELLSASNEIWRALAEADWSEAFQSHPRIGQTRAEKGLDDRTAAWSIQEQQSANLASDHGKSALAEANGRYEERFGRIFIVCAMGKSAKEILAIWQRRMKNDPETELQEAAEQQRQITQIRLRKWLNT